MSFSKSCWGCCRLPGIQEEFEVHVLERTRKNGSNDWAPRLISSTKGRGFVEGGFIWNLSMKQAQRVI
jgi:hypothetical protein